MMGAINFDPSPWLSAGDKPASPAKAANVAKEGGPGPLAFAKTAALATPPRLSSDIERGLDVLARAAPPYRYGGNNWGEVVEDAMRLREQGWAATALSLGWTPFDLFGIGRKGSFEWESLAVWLAGRALSVMDDHRAFTACGQVYYLERWGRSNTPFEQPIYLWEWAA